MSAAGLILLSLYLLGIVAAAAMAWLLRRTLLKGQSPALVMELPPYRMPRLGAVVRQVGAQALLFLRKVWTVILALTVILWFLQSFPRNAATQAEDQTRREEWQQLIEASPNDASRSPLEAELADFERQSRARRLEQSFAGRIGRGFEPLIQPLGFDWRIGIGLLASFAAREVLVSTMAQVFAVEDSEDAVTDLETRLREAQDPATGKRLYRPLVGLSLAVFFVLACQCMSTVAVVRRETASWRWPLFMVAYMTVLAWCASFVTYQVGSWMGF